MADDEPISVEVVYAEPARAVVKVVQVTAGVSVREVIECSGILDEVGGDAASRPVGIFGRVVPLDTPVGAGDRIELYRPLTADPKQARRRRAVQHAGARSRNG